MPAKRNFVNLSQDIEYLFMRGGIMVFHNCNFLDGANFLLEGYVKC